MAFITTTWLGSSHLTAKISLCSIAVKSTNNYAAKKRPNIIIMATPPGYSIADQKQRYAKAVKENNQFVLNIDSVYKPEKLKGKRALVTGGNRGLGFSIVNELVKAGCYVIVVCRSISNELTTLSQANPKLIHIVPGVDVTSDDSVKQMQAKLNGQAKVDYVINNAGYFMKERESILSDTLDFSEEMKTIDVCSVGMLRITSALWKNKMIAQGSQIVYITSQGGSIAWRDTQCPEGGDYGHHMSKVSANMMAKLVANELKSKGVIVLIAHPGFNKTEMTRKYEKIWEEEGAVDSSVGARRVLHQMNEMTMEKTGMFINCEDGLQIPW